MRVGVKFCGGCNETYSRGQYYIKLRESLKDFDFEYALSNVEYDRLLVICGCKSACASIDGFLFHGNPIVITQEEEFYSVKKRLEEY